MPTGKGRRPAPPGYMSAARAGELLGSSRMYKLTQADRLHRYTPPGLKHGYYSEQEVQGIIAADKAFYEEKYHKLPAHFSHARASDMQSLYDLAVRIFGGSTISAEKRASWIRAESRGNYVIKRPDTGQVIGYFYTQALTHERIMQYMRECRGSTIQSDDILPIRPGAPLELIIAGIGKDPRADKQYASALLHGFAQDLASWARDGIEISKFYAYSETLDGIYLSFSIGMELWKRPRYMEGEGPFFTFVLDVEKSNSPLLRPYKQALQEYRRVHGLDPAKPMPAPRQARQSLAPAGSELPEGLISLSEYAAEHKLALSTLKNAEAAGYIIPPFTRGRWKQGRNIIQIALNAECRAAIEARYGKHE